MAALQGRAEKAEAERDEAELCLDRAGWERTPNGRTWRPKLGPSVAPLLDRIDAAYARIAALEEALRASLSANDSHYAHHDSMGTAGANCPACKARRSANELARAALTPSSAQSLDGSPRGETDHDKRIERLSVAIEGECGGLAITPEQATSILAYLDTGDEPAPPTTTESAS